MFQDLQHGARLLRRSPGFTFLAVVSLVTGLGSGVALFTMMNAALFRPLPGVDTGDIYVVYTSNSDGGRYNSSSYADFRSFVSLAPDLFAASGAATNVRANMVVDGGLRSLAGAVVSGGYFDLLRLPQQRGRLLSRSDDEPTGRSPAVVISYALWLNGFGGDADTIGREVVINGASAVIVGVTPRGFAGLSLDSGAEFWASAPLAGVLLPPDTLTNRRLRRFRVFARLRDGVPSTQVVSRLAIVAEQLRAEDPQAWTDARASTRTITVVRELQARFVGNPAAGREIATVVLGAIAGIVALACVNLATMVMARGAARTRELNLRLALGASRGRLLQQLVTESLLIAVPSGALSVLMVAAALKLFDSYRPVEIPSFNLAIDWSVVGFAALIALMASLLFGLAPGVHAIRLAIADGLKGRPPLIRRRWLRAGPRELLLVVQVTVSFGLLVVASVFTRSLIAVGSEAPGLSTANIAVVALDLNTASPSGAGSSSLVGRLLRAADGVPGVDRATAAAIVPMTGSSIGFAGRPLERPDGPWMEFDGNVVAPGYFDLVGIPLRAGRAFDEGDHEQAPRVAVVSDSLARRLWDSPAVVGRRISLRDNQSVEVVGVAADVPYRSIVDPVQPVIYVPIAQTTRSRFMLHARVKNESETLVALDRALRTVDARVVVGTPISMSRFLDQARAPARATQWIGGVVGLLQFGLALMAIWGLVAYAAERRTAEIGVRLALGATPAAIAQLVMRPSVLLVVAGIVMGGVAGVAGARVLHSTVDGLAPIDLAAAIPAAVIFTAVAAAAAWIPARRATAIEPASALRQQ